MAVAQQLGFQVSSAQRPRLRHQLPSLIEAVGGTWAASVEMYGGSLLFAISFLYCFFCRDPLGVLARLARLLLLAAAAHGDGARCIINVGLHSASGI